MSAPVTVRTPPRVAEWKKIPENMRALWQACLPDQEGADVARSLTVNFVGVAFADDAASLRDAVERLQRRTPARAFLLLIDAAATKAEAELSATTRCHGNMRDIVLEEITIRLQPATFDAMPGLIRPLLMNDLPNHLYWAAPWPEREADFDALAALCDHVVVDSRRFADAEKGLAAVQQRRQAGKRISDLSWLRVRPWRRAIAEAFERVQWRTGTRVTGEVKHGRGVGASARLLADWLRSRLSADVKIDGAADQAVQGIESVTLRTDTFEVDMELHGRQIRVHVATPEHCFLPFTMPASRGVDGDLLAAAIDLE